MAAQASDWRFYGIVTLTTILHDVDNGGSYFTFDTDDTKLGARIRVNDKLRARFEYGPEAEIKKLWGEWKFGRGRTRGRLLVGHAYTPVYMDYGIDYYGGISAGRSPLIQLRFKGLKMAAIEPETTEFKVKGAAPKALLPKFEASYNWDIGHFSFEAAGGFNTYELAGRERDYTIDSYILGLGAEFRLPPFYFAGNIFTGRNLEAYGLKIKTDGNPAIANGRVLDNRGYGFLLVGQYSFSDTILSTLGFGFQESLLDNAISADAALTYYINTRLTLGTGIYITPQIGIIDERKDAMGNREEKSRYFSIEWQIQF